MEGGKRGDKAKKRKAELTPTVSPTPFPAPLTVSPNQSKSEYTPFFFGASPSSCPSFFFEEDDDDDDRRGSKDEPVPPVTPAAVPPRSPLPRADVVSPTVFPRPLIEGKGLNRLVRGVFIGVELGMLSGKWKGKGERRRGFYSPGGATSCLADVFCGKERSR